MGFKVFVIFTLFAILSPVKSVERDMYALWDSTYSTDSYGYVATYLHRRFESVFNHYGIRLKYIDISKLDKNTNWDELLKGKLGVVSWFTGTVGAQTENLIKMYESIAKNDKKLMVLGNWGFSIDNKNKGRSLESINKSLSKLGAELLPKYINNQIFLAPVYYVDKKDVEFERSLKGEITEIDGVRMLKGAGGKRWLSVKDKRDGLQYDVVFETKNLFYAQNYFSMHRDPASEKTTWRMNPFKAVKTLIDDQFPIYPEISTLMGRRAFYTHIDGDGFLNKSFVDRKNYSAAILRDKVFGHYDIPFTVSIVESEVSSLYAGNKELEQIARDIFLLPNVEPASHTFTHPLSWNKVPTEQEKKVYKVKPGSPYNYILSFQHKGYQLDYQREIKGSLGYVDQMSPKNKQGNNVLLWSGSCMPPKEALQVIEKYGFLNMNGGDGRFDREYNSYSNLSALYRQVGEYKQIYTSFGNENIFTNLWSGPFWGFKDVIESFVRTEKPFRIRPINVYYHFYSGDYHASLNALTEIYDWILKQNTIPIYSSRYIRMIQSYITMKLKKLRHYTYQLSQSKYIQSMRIEDRKYKLNMNKSKNVLGYKRDNGILYIHLAQTSNKVISFESENSRYSGPILKESNCLVTQINSKRRIISGICDIDNGFVQISNLNLKRIAKKSEYKVDWKSKKIVIKSRGPFKIKY